MKLKFQPVLDKLFRLDIPFDNLYTSVFLIEDTEPILVDSATTPFDVTEYILPALAERGITTDTDASLLITHTHGDHNGGTPSLLAALPKLQRRTLFSGSRFGSIVAHPLGGHTLSSMGYLDTRTEALLCGDGLQFYGVGKYGCSIADADVYEKTLELVAALDPASIVPSHDFVGGAAAAIGRPEARALLVNARECWEKLKQFVLTASGKGADVEETVTQFRIECSHLPPLPRITVKAILEQSKNKC